MRRPTIIVYAADIADGDIPGGMMFAAAMVPILKPGKTSKSKDPYVPGSQWLCTGPTADAARAKLRALWDAQYPPVDKRKGPKPKAVANVDVVL